MDKLSDALRYAFHNCRNHYHALDSDSTLFTQVIVPVSDDVFEVPVFVFDSSSVIDEIRKGTVTTVVADVNYRDVHSHYKSVFSTYCSAITENFIDTGLIKIPSKENEGDCYITHGAIFDSRLNPLLVLTWKVERKVPVGDESYKNSLNCLCPIVRIAPQVILEKNNAVNRCIVNKVLPSVLSLTNVHTSGNYSKTFQPKVIIDSIPFTVRKPSVPSVNTTNDDLIHSALDHFDDFIL